MRSLFDSQRAERFGIRWDETGVPDVCAVANMSTVHTRPLLQHTFRVPISCRQTWTNQIVRDIDVESLDACNHVAKLPEVIEWSIPFYTMSVSVIAVNDLM